MKKKIIIISLWALLGVFLTLLNIREYYVYNKNYSLKLNSISANLKDLGFSDSEIFVIIKNDNESGGYLEKFGYNLSKDSVIENNKKSLKEYMFYELGIGVGMFILIGGIYGGINYKRNKEIKKIIKLIDSINKRNYDLEIDDSGEGLISILKNEIYKVTIMLRSEADNSLKDKKELKKALEDISHQLKTPLTSLIINLDNIIDNNKLGEEEKKQLVRKMRKEVYNLKFLIP